MWRLVSLQKASSTWLVGWSRCLYVRVTSSVGLHVASAVVFQGTSFHNRVTINSVFGFLGVLGVALSGRISFAFAVASVTLIGLMSSFGESVLLGFLKYYPSSMAGAWSSGTGMAGVFGSAFYLALHGAGVSNEAIFYTMLPPILLYWAAFVWMLRKPISAPQASDAAPGQNAGPPKTSYSLLNADAARAADPGDVEVAAMAGGARGGGDSSGSRQRKHNQPSATVDVPSTNVVARTDGAGVVGFARAWRCTRVVAWAGFNLFMVYFAEYVVSVGCAAKANPASFDTSSSWFERNAYAVLAFCYQIGVMCSRSSLSIIRVRRFGLLTVLQLINLVLWLLQAGYHVVGVWVQFAAMIYVGLIGGAMYVNVFAELVEDPKIEERDRELCINIASIFNNIGACVSQRRVQVWMCAHRAVPLQASLRRRSSRSRWMPRS